MSITSRSTVRLAVATAVQTVLAGIVPSGNVLANLPGPFAGATPLVLVLSGGSARKPFSYGADDLPSFLLSLRVYVLLSTPDGAWTEVDAEARLDAIEAGIARMCLDYQHTATWQNIQYNGVSKVEDVMTIDGFVYRRETIPILVECETDA